MDDAAHRWLDEREPVPPTELRSRLHEDLAGTDVLSVRFTEAALRRLRVARERPGERAAAFELLVADAYLTYACEAAVDRGTPAVGTQDGARGTEEVLRDTLRAVADQAV